MNADLIKTIVLSILPVSELRGAIPYAVYKGFSIPIAASISIAANICVPAIAFLFLESLHRLLYKIPQYRRFFDSFVDRARTKVHTKVEKYGYWGLLLFVAIPLPATGAWTGTLGAWVLGLSHKKPFCYCWRCHSSRHNCQHLGSLMGVSTQTIFFKPVS